MAYGSNKSQFVLESGIIQIGVFTAPETIGTDADFPSNKFVGDKIGTIKRGTQIASLGLEFVEAMEGTPQALIRKDVINAPFTIAGEIFEFNADTIANIMHRVSQPAYGVTTPSVKTIDLHHIGSRVDVISEVGILIQANDVECRDLEIAMYAGIFTQEGNEINQSGDDYAVVQFSAQATPHAGFGITKDARAKHYGYIMIDRT